MNPEHKTHSRKREYVHDEKVNAYLDFSNNMLNLLRFQELMGVQILLVRQVFVKNEPQYVVPKLISIYLAAQGVSYAP